MVAHWQPIVYSEQQGKTLLLFLFVANFKKCIVCITFSGYCIIVIDKSYQQYCQLR